MSKNARRFKGLRVKNQIQKELGVVIVRNTWDSTIEDRVRINNQRGRDRARWPGGWFLLPGLVFGAAIWFALGWMVLS